MFHLERNLRELLDPAEYFLRWEVLYSAALWKKKLSWAQALKTDASEVHLMAWVNTLP